MTPIYQTSTYVQDGLGRHKGYEYARTQNPTREALERNVAASRAARHGFAFGSGLAALDTVLKLLRSGDHVVCGENVYGGTHRLMERVYSELGLRFTFVDMRDVGKVERALTPATRMVYCETPTNPMMNLVDLAAVGDLTQARGLLYVVDNTFATPYFQRPLEFGADIVLHSTTKYLNGHSDMVGGLLVTRRDDLAERLGFLQNAAGGGARDRWTAGWRCGGSRRSRSACGSTTPTAGASPSGSASDPTVTKLYYPGLPSHPQHELACRQMTGFGGMISLDLGDPARARRFVEATRIFALAESLGGVESLIGHPASMTHASVPPAMRQAMGLTDSLVRLSCGVEDTDDLIEDLDQAFAAVRSLKVKPRDRVLVGPRIPNLEPAMSTSLPAQRPRQTFPQISGVSWEHPADRAALQALRSVPGVDEVIRKTLALLGGERGVRLLFQGNAVRVGPAAVSQALAPAQRGGHDVRLAHRAGAVRLPDPVLQRRRLRHRPAVHRRPLGRARAARRRRAAGADGP